MHGIVRIRVAEVIVQWNEIDIMHGDVVRPCLRRGQKPNVDELPAIEAIIVDLVDDENVVLDTLLREKRRDGGSELLQLAFGLAERYKQLR